MCLNNNGLLVHKEKYQVYVKDHKDFIIIDETPYEVTFKEPLVFSADSYWIGIHCKTSTMLAFNTLNKFKTTGITVGNELNVDHIPTTV